MRYHLLQVEWKPLAMGGESGSHTGGCTAAMNTALRLGEGILCPYSPEQFSHKDLQPVYLGVCVCVAGEKGVNFTRQFQQLLSGSV